MRFAIILLSYLAIAGPLHAEILFKADFETRDLSQVDSVHVDAGAKVEVVRNPAGDGWVMKSSITPQQERAEIRAHRDPAPSERWYGWSLLLPDDYVEVKGKSDILFQWHRGGNLPKWAASHPMTFMINEDGFYKITHTHQTDPAKPETRVNLSGATKFTYKDDRGKWVQWALHAKWSVRDDGYLALYRDGEKAWEYKGANWLSGVAGPMVKAGIYTGDPGWEGNNPTVVYHDNIFVGDENSSIREVSPPLAADPQVGVGAVDVERANPAVANSLPAWETHERPAADPLRVGFAENDITPPVGYRKAGGYSEVVSTGIDAPLLAKAVVLEQGNVRCAVVLSDLTGVSEPLTTQARQAIAEQTGIPFGSIVIAATHNHAAPEYWGPLRDIWHEAAVARHGRDAVESVDYPALLVDRWIDVVVQAQARAQRADLSLLVTQQPALAFNRRFHMRDGSVRFNPGKGNPDILRPAGPVDIELPFLLARDETGRALGSLTVFAMHTATAGGRNFGPDFPGRLATNLRSTFGEPFISIFAEGTAGDVNHVDVRRTEKQSGATEPARIGDTLAATITHGVEQLRLLQHPSLAIRSQIIRWPIKPGVREEDYRAAKQRIAEQKANRAAFLDLVAAWRDCHRWELQQRHGDKKPLEVQVVRLDTDTAIVTLPHEVFVELGIGIKSASPFRNTLVMTLAGDVDFYIPTRRAFEEGSYEVTTCPLVPGCGEALVAAALEMLNELKEP